MHDVIRDMALWLAHDCSKNKEKVLVGSDALSMFQVDVEKKKIVERVSIIKDDKLHVLTDIYCPNLKTFFIKGDGIKGLQNIQYLRTLKVLEISAGKERLHLPAEIGGLVNLEYLSLEKDIRASEFAIELKNLKNLKFFSLYNIWGDLVSFPLEVISSLRQLRVLRLCINAEQKSGEERKLLEELESLPNLEELWIQIRTENGFNKLLGSTMLQICIWDLTLENMGTPIKMPSLLASISKMKHLQRMWFNELNIVEDSSTFSTGSLTMLQLVRIIKCHSIIHLTWLKYAPVLQYLCIRNCESMEEVIKEEAKDDKGIENVDNIFSSLVELDLWGLPRLKSIHKTSLPFPSLRSIKIIHCQNLKKLPFDSYSAKEKLREIVGTQDWWDNLGWEDPAIREKFLSKFQAL